MIRNAFIAVAFVSLVLSGLPVAYAGNHAQPVPDIVEYCDSLTFTEYCRFVRELGKKKRLAELEKIFNSGVDHYSYAATIYALSLHDAQVIPFCKRFQVGSENWVAAFFVLDTRKREIVIQYIKQTVQSSSPRIRSLCYEICTRAKWQDLEEFAKKDISNKTQLPQAGIGETLGSIARRYISTCNMNGPHISR
jgi:hypothetical protein